ncbi:hypothetical protein [Streptococcus pneumoniae]|uniref:hypothetical protein n=1 Tax=Streptococcus pneumoniae TaxID=1313 RepID=UPI0015DA8091|nr:hypothetical protein [Streptococcus pneumoniae]
MVYSIKIKEQTRKLAAVSSKHCFEVMDETDEVSSKHGLLTWFEEIFEELTKSTTILRQDDADVV